MPHHNAPAGLEQDEAAAFVAAASGFALTSDERVAAIRGLSTLAEARTAGAVIHGSTDQPVGLSANELETLTHLRAERLDERDRQVLCAALRELADRRRGPAPAPAATAGYPLESYLNDAEREALELARHTVRSGRGTGMDPGSRTAVTVLASLEELASRRHREVLASEAADVAPAEPRGIAEVLAARVDSELRATEGLDGGLGRVGIAARALRDYQEARKIELELNPVPHAADVVASVDRELEEAREEVAALATAVDRVIGYAYASEATPYFEPGSALEPLGLAIDHLRNVRGIEA